MPVLIPRARYIAPLVCELCTTIRDNLRGVRKLPGSRNSADWDIPRAKDAKIATLGIYFSVPLRPLRALREIFRILVARLLRYDLRGAMEV